MEIIAKFEKVSFEKFKESCEALRLPVNNADVIAAYEKVRLPRRATKGSAGYDFFATFSVSLKKGESFVFPTGVRCKMNEGWALNLFPRSGMGFKTGARLANTVGIIDQDYYYSDNEGHIMVKLLNDGVMGKHVTISVGDAICQGIFLPFGIAEGDTALRERNGGFGSTDR